MILREHGIKHPTRGKAMKADKLFYVFELTRKRLIGFMPQPGNTTLANTALEQVKELISEVKPESVRMQRARSHYFDPERT